MPVKHPRNSARRILVVDDETAIRKLYSAVLMGCGYQVDTAEDGEAGWKVLHAVRYDPGSYDLLITDNNMPKLSGFELIKKLRSARMTLPIILATSEAPMNIEELQLAAILQKPFYPGELVQTVNEVLLNATPLDPIFSLGPGHTDGTTAVGPGRPPSRLTLPR